MLAAGHDGLDLSSKDLLQGSLSKNLTNCIQSHNSSGSTLDLKKKKKSVSQNQSGTLREKKTVKIHVSYEYSTEGLQRKKEPDDDADNQSDQPDGLVKNASKNTITSQKSKKNLKNNSSGIL